MTDQPVDPAYFFDNFSRYVETDAFGSGPERLNARYLALIHKNRQLLEGATVLDLASHDGRFSFAALQNGAARVIGIEWSADLIKHGLVNMEHYGVPSNRYDFLLGDIYERIEELEQCDVVLCFGIFYHITSHMLLLTKIADLDPRAVIIDTAVSRLQVPAIELRSGAAARPLKLGEQVEGHPSRAALDAMLSSFGWKYDYFDWEQSGLLERTQMQDYQRGVRVSVVVDCNRQTFSEMEKMRAVQMVLDKQRDPGRNGRRSWKLLRPCRYHDMPCAPGYEQRNAKPGDSV
jgi:predicted nicotinamide N-methyase